MLFKLDFDSFEIFKGFIDIAEQQSSSIGSTLPQFHSNSLTGHRIDSIDLYSSGLEFDHSPHCTFISYLDPSESPEIYCDNK